MNAERLIQTSSEVSKNTLDIVSGALKRVLHILPGYDVHEPIAQDYSRLNLMPKPEERINHDAYRMYEPADNVLLFPDSYNTGIEVKTPYGAILNGPVAPIEVAARGLSTVSVAKANQAQAELAF